MPPDSDALLLTRRRWFASVAGATAMGSALCGHAYGFASDFWNKKEAAEWSQDEVRQMLTKSPWAKQVTAEATRSGGSGGGSRPSGTGNTGMGSGGMGTGGNSRGGSGGGGRNSGIGGMGGSGTNNRNMGNAGDMGGTTKMPKGGQQYKGVVRWETAKPVVEAGKAKLPDAFANHYVISVSGIPVPGRKADAEGGGDAKLSNAAAERIKAGSSLTAKGKEPVAPDLVQVLGAVLLLGFPQDKLKLTPEDKEVAFAAMIGRVAVKTKFNLKEMMYHESLAV